MNRRSHLTTFSRIAQLRLGLIRVLRSTVAKNATSLYSIQFASYLLPLVTVPYLVRVLKPERFGTVAFGQGLMAYFMTLVEYGFGLSATRRISAVRENHEMVSRIVSNVMAARMMLCGGSFLLVNVLIHFMPRLHDVSTLLLVLYGSVIGIAIFPSWLFQGLERMASLSVINLSARFAGVVALFLVVRREEDYLTYAALISAQSLLSGGAGIFVAYRKFQLNAVWPTWTGITESLREGWVTFLSISAITLYTSGNAFILGMLTNDAIVGYYSAAEKIVRAALSVLAPISQAAYPRFSKMAIESKEAALRWARRMLLLMGGIGFLMSASIFACSGLIVHLILGARFGASGPVIRTLALLPLLVGVSNVLGIQILFPFRQDRGVLISVALGGLVNVGLAFLFAPIFKAQGMAVSVLAAEFVVTATQVYFVVKMDLNPLCLVRDGQAMVQSGVGVEGLEI